METLVSTPTGSPILRGLDEFNVVAPELDAQRISSVRPREDIAGFPSIRVANASRSGVEGGRSGG
jgi:hypothetical protein